MSLPIPEGSFRPTQFFSPEKGPANPCSSYPIRDYSTAQQPHLGHPSGANGLASPNSITESSTGMNYSYSEASSSQYR
jgi:hypothetical protein